MAAAYMIQFFFIWFPVPPGVHWMMNVHMLNCINQLKECKPPWGRNPDTPSRPPRKSSGSPDYNPLSESSSMERR